MSLPGVFSWVDLPIIFTALQAPALNLWSLRAYFMQHRFPLWSLCCREKNCHKVMQPFPPSWQTVMDMVASFLWPEIIKVVLKVQRRNEADKNLYLLHDRNQESNDSIDRCCRKKRWYFSITYCSQFCWEATSGRLEEINIWAGIVRAWRSTCMLQSYYCFIP